jgi:hypothetical protein
MPAPGIITERALLKVGQTSMANRSDRRFQILIYPEAATASREADEEKTRGFPCRLDAQKSHHNEAEYTDAVQTRTHALPVLAQHAGVHIRGYKLPNIP